MRIQRLASCLLTIALLSCTLPLHVFAQSSGAITDIITPINKNTAHDTASVQPGTVLKYPLTADMFSWFGAPGQEGAPVTSTQLRQANITVRHSTSQPQIIKDITLSTMRYNGQTTACVNIEFAEEFVSVNKREFRLTVFLSMRNTRMEASEIILLGDFENEEVEIDSSMDFVNLAGGKVLTVSSGSITNLEIDMGDGVQLFTKVSSGRRYYAAARNRMTNADDAMFTKYPALETVVRLRTINLAPSGKCVSMKDIGSYHLYDASGAYLGKTDELVVFSELYYLTSEKIDMGGGTSSTPPGGSNDSNNNQRPPFGNTPEENAAGANMTSSAAEALRSGTSRANVRLQDVEKISASELQAMFEAASRVRIRSMYTIDTTTPGSMGRPAGVQGRIEINPAFAVRLDKDIYLGVHTTGSEVERITSFFEKHYSNRISVMHLTHEGSYGMSVKIAAKLNTDINRNSVHLYYYDIEGNRIRTLPDAGSFIDQSGYIHFNTIFGGKVIVSDGPLTRRREA